MRPIACPTCGETDWTQTQDYAATDRHWLTWIYNQHGAGHYNFTYEQVATSDENTNRWKCSNGHEASDDITEAIEELDY
jgi:hypothetical protein